MEFLRSSPAKLLKLKEKLNEIGANSSSFLSQESQRHFEALNLSARKNRSRTLPAELSSNPPLARSLFPLANSPSVKDKFHENVRSIKDVIDALPSPRTFGKRKYSSSLIINDNRGNYEPVDLTVDLCCDSIETEEVSCSKKMRMSV